MASPAALFSPPNSKIRLFKGKLFQLHSHSAICCTKNSPISVISCVKLRPMAQFMEPQKLKIHMNYAREKFLEVLPDSAKDFLWKKAETTAQQHLLVLGQQILKWSLIGVFICSFLSDIIYSISRNKELMIPFGLFVGCLMTDFLKETSEELSPDSQGRGFHWHLVGVGCFWVLVKIISSYFGLVGWVFLLHAANGGLMQVFFWLWKSSPEGQDRDNRETSLVENVSPAGNSQD